MARRSLITSLIMICIVLSLTNCENLRCIKGNDNLVTEDADNIGSFDKIVLDASYDVSITQDTITAVSILADDNLIPYITAETAGNELILSTANRRCLRSKNDIRIYVSTPVINKIESEGSGDIVVSDILLDTITAGENTEDRSLEVILKGSGNIDFGDIYCDKLIVDLLGSGEIFVSDVNIITIDVFLNGSGDLIFKSGVGDIGLFTNDGSGDIVADKVELYEADVTVNGSGDIYVWAYYNLYGEINGSGNVFYRALPLRGINIVEKGSGIYIPLSN